MNVSSFPRRRTRLFALALLTLAGPALAAPNHPGSGNRPRRDPPRQATPRPPPPPSGEWTTQVGPRTPATAPAPAPEPPPAIYEVRPEEPRNDAPPEPFFDDRPPPHGFDGTWVHEPSIFVISTETYTEDACTRLLEDSTLAPPARALLLGGRARARMRMWRLDTAVQDIEAALALDPRAAQLHLIHAEILACLGRTDEADAILQQAFRLDPESTLTARALGLIRLQQGSLQTAADALAFHLEQAASTGLAAGDATLPLLRAVAAGETGSLDAGDNPSAPWAAQLAAFLSGRITRDTLLARARDPRGTAPDEAACTAWYYIAHRTLVRGDRERAGREYLAALRTGCTAIPEYRLAAAALIRLGVLQPGSLPGRYDDQPVR